MPEAPDLQVVKDVLNRRIVGHRITQARVVRPTVLRSLASSDFAADIVGRSLEEAHPGASTCCSGSPASGCWSSTQC